MNNLEKYDAIEEFITRKLQSNLKTRENFRISDIPHRIKDRLDIRIELLRQLRRHNEDDRVEAILIALGCKEVEVGEDYATFHDGTDYITIETCFIDETTTFDQLYLYQCYVSCCGDILDADYMICPTCGEHC